MTIKEEITFFRELTERMCDTFSRKRTDYGQTSTETFKKFGPISMYIRMYDKMGRLENLMVNGGIDHVGESVKDTLLDLANYALITLLEYEKVEGEKCVENVERERCRVRPDDSSRNTIAE